MLTKLESFCTHSYRLESSTTITIKLGTGRFLHVAIRREAIASYPFIPVGIWKWILSNRGFHPISANDLYSSYTNASRGEGVGASIPHTSNGPKSFDTQIWSLDYDRHSLWIPAFVFSSLCTFKWNFVLRTPYSRHVSPSDAIYCCIIRGLARQKKYYEVWNIKFILLYWY